MHIAITAKGWSFGQMKCCQHFLNLRGSRTNWRFQSSLAMTLVELTPRAVQRNCHLSTSNYLTSAHVDGRRLNPMVNQRSADIAGTAIKAMPTRTKTADANG